MSSLKFDLWKGDCLELMKDIPDGSVDLILTDPPYLISKKSNFHTMKDRKNQRTGTDFGEWDYEFSNGDWINLCSSKLRGGGTLLAFNDFKKATEIVNIATEHELIYKDTLVWHKTNPMPRNRDRRFISNIEMIQLYVKPKNKWTFNRQNDKYESSVLSFPVESGGVFKRYHPTQKSVKLLEYLVSICSNTGDTVLDLFSGSFSTAIACLNTDRNFIGIELDDGYFDIGVNRIKEHIESNNMNVDLNLKYLTVKD